MRFMKVDDIALAHSFILMNWNGCNGCCCFLDTFKDLRKKSRGKQNISIRNIKCNNNVNKCKFVVIIIIFYNFSNKMRFLIVCYLYKGTCTTKVPKLRLIIHIPILFHVKFSNWSECSWIYSENGGTCALYNT